MNSYILKSIHMAIVLCVLVVLPAKAQEKAKIQILDTENNIPVIGAVYHYAGHNGLSDENGFIYITYVQEEMLSLSHINYGKWQVEGPELANALQKGKLYRREHVVALQPVSVISLKMAEEKDQKIIISDQERLHHDAGAILNQNPVISSIRKSGAFAFDPVMRGFKYDQLNIVIDGLQSANAACPNRMDPPTSQVALNRIKQVEILKGPHALRYGIGLGGTINFIQEDPRFSAENGVYGRFSSMYESNGQVIRNEGRVGFTGSHHDVGFMGSWSKGTDYTDGRGNVVPADFMRGTVGMYGDFKISSVDLLQVTVNRNFARDVSFPTLAMDLRSDDTWMGSIRHSRTFKNRHLQRWTTSGFFTLVDHLMDNGLRELNPRMMDARTPANTQNMGARTEGLWQLGKGRMYAGADFRTEAAQGVRERTFLMGPNEGMSMYDNAWQDSRINKAGLFAAYHLPISEYVLSFSGRLDVNQASADERAGEFVDVNATNEVTQLNPGISAGIKRDLGEYFNMGLWVARVQRSGSITERFINYFPVGLDPYELLGNPDLKPETNNQVDWVVGFSKSGITAEVSLFAAYLNNYITGERTDLSPRLPTSPGVRQFVNVDRALKSGFEVAFRQDLIYGFNHQLMLAYTYGQNLTVSEALPEVAPMDVRYVLMGNHLDNRLHTAIRLRHVVGQDRISESFGERATPKFTLFDVDASYTLTANVAIKGGVQNLFDQGYYEHLNRPITGMGTPLLAPGRNVFLMLSVKFP